MVLAWKFASFDDEPLVWLGGSAFVRTTDGGWVVPDPSWIVDAKALSKDVFVALFGEFPLPAFPYWMLEDSQSPDFEALRDQSGGGHEGSGGVG